MFELLVLIFIASRIAKDQFPISGLLLLWIVIVSLPFIAWFLLVGICTASVEYVGKTVRRLCDAMRTP